MSEWPRLLASWASPSPPPSETPLVAARDAVLTPPHVGQAHLRRLPREPAARPWLRDAPARLKDRVPRVESTPEGDVWVVDQKASPVQGLTFMGGRDYKDYTPRVAYKEMRPGSWDPQARLADMDQDGILADVLYGGGPSRFDEPELRAFCTQRYNDWLFELERASGGRLVGISILPINGGVAETCAELERVAKQGARGVQVDAFPD